MIFKRSGGLAFIFSDEQKKNVENNACPMCGLPKSDWKRRTDWRCCSVDCTKKFGEVVVFYWPTFRLKVFERDNYTCVSCKKKYVFKPGYSDLPLVADHIRPISLGGEEWDLNNLQTLCVDCNKEKTKKDMALISIERRVPCEQRRLI